MVIGHVTHDSARIWLSGDAQHTQLQASLTAGGQSHTQAVNTDSERDFTGVLEFYGLQADTLYTVRSQERTGSFRTFPSPDSRTPFRFLLNSCNFHGWGPIRSHARACRRRLELVGDCRFGLHVGDQIYADQPWPCLTREDFRQAYRRVWHQPDTQRLFANLPNYMIADDHEVLDGFAWDGAFTLYQRLVMAVRGQFRPSPQLYHQLASNGMQTFDEFQSCHGPRSYEPARYFHFSYGEHQFFALDLRFERQLRQGRMISEAQMEALFEWLLRHRDRPKFVITSSPFVVEKIKASEKWCGPEFYLQRHRIIEFLALHDLRNVVFLSGDIHASCHAEMEIENAQGNFFTLHELCASPLNGTLQRPLDSFHGESQRTTENGTRYRVRLDRDSFLGRPRWGGTSNSALMLVSVDGDQIGYELHRTRRNDEQPARSGSFQLPVSESVPG